MDQKCIFPVQNSENDNIYANWRWRFWFVWLWSYNQFTRRTGHVDCHPVTCGSGTFSAIYLNSNNSVLCLGMLFPLQCCPYNCLKNKMLANSKQFQHSIYFNSTDDLPHQHSGPGWSQRRLWSRVSWISGAVNAVRELCLQMICLWLLGRNTPHLLRQIIPKAAKKTFKD